jgi:hypothetical protein
MNSKNERKNKEFAKRNKDHENWKKIKQIIQESD